jgi:hypothetical protein
LESKEAKMNAILITLNVIVLLCLAALGYEWPPALFAFLVVGPFSALSLWGISSGDVSARTIFVTTTVVAVGGIAMASFFAVSSFSTAASPSRCFGSRIVIVTGKGGCGKTTIASAIASGAAERGMRVALVEMGRD